MIICFIEEARRERNTVEYHRNLVELEVRTCDSRGTETSRAYFRTRLLPTVKSDRHPTNDLRPHAVLEIRGNLLMNPHNTVILSIAPASPP